MTHVEATKLTVASAALTLEARWDLPADPGSVVVLCHPHPQQRGTMNAPLMVAIADGLVARDFAVLRFNFRGVGKSEGEHDFGHGELDDVAAAVEAAGGNYPDLPLGVAGWSFGAVTSLRWQAREASRLPWVGIAPPVGSSRSLPLPNNDELAGARRTVILGDRDQFTTVSTTADYAASIGAEMQVISGSDHFFHFREERVARLVAEGLTTPA